MKTSRPLYEGVDWNNVVGVLPVIALRRPLYEGVDWNIVYIILHLCENVALFTRAWIEIYSLSSLRCPEGVALFTRAWIEINHLAKFFNSSSVALFTRAWIEILSILYRTIVKTSRPLYEGVDWNIACYGVCRYCHVALFTRAWIEIVYRAVIVAFSIGSPSLRGRGLKYKTII